MESWVLLVTTEYDPTADVLIGRLQRRGQRFLRWNIDRFPADSALTLRITDGDAEGTIKTDGRSLDLRQVGSAWYRGFRAAGFPPDLTPEELRFAKTESQSALLGLARITPWRWINPPELDRAACCKPAQLAVARQVGLEVPPTLISNDPEDVRVFYQACDGRMIYKPFSQSPDLRPGQAIFTGQVSADHLGSLESIRHTPGIFQELVPKAFELRVTIVAGTVFPVEIHSQRVDEAKLDWRAAPFQLEYRPHALPPEVETKLLQFMNRFGIVYGAMDLIVTPDGRYVFLENNPAGQFGWIESATGLPITDRLAEALIGPSCS